MTTAGERAERLLKTNPKWREAPKFGAVCGIGGVRSPGLVSLSDKQLAIVMDAAAELPIEKPALLLEQIAALSVLCPLLKRAGRIVL